jgi:hypothetical protein
VHKAWFILHVFDLEHFGPDRERVCSKLAGMERGEFFLAHIIAWEARYPPSVFAHNREEERLVARADEKVE